VAKNNKTITKTRNLKNTKIMKTHAADYGRKEFCLFLDLRLMVLIVVSYFRDFVIKDLFLSRILWVGGLS
jgi:hypothetical protein